MEIKIIDSFVGFYPFNLGNFLGLSAKDSLFDRLSPVTSGIHNLLSASRFLPGFVQNASKGIGHAVATPMYLLDSSQKDLLRKMKRLGIERSLVVHQPHLEKIENFLARAKKNTELIPIMTFEINSKTNSESIRKHLDSEIKGIHIVLSSFTKRSDIGPVVDLLSTIKIPIHLSIPGYKPKNFEIYHRFFNDLGKSKKTPVIFTHIHNQQTHYLLRNIDTRPSFYVQTAWQPGELIADMVRRLGEDRVIFSSAWPTFGHSIKVSLNRAKDALRYGMISDKILDKILYKNAQSIYNIK